jgi:hypothetical protein
VFPPLLLVLGAPSRVTAGNDCRQRTTVCLLPLSVCGVHHSHQGRHFAAGQPAFVAGPLKTQPRSGLLRGSPPAVLFFLDFCQFPASQPAPFGIFVSPVQAGAARSLPKLLRRICLTGLPNGPASRPVSLPDGSQFGHGRRVADQGHRRSRQDTLTHLARKDLERDRSINGWGWNLETGLPEWAG